MSRFKPEAAEPVPVATTTTPAPTDAEAELPRWQRPSSFATRKAQADANNAELSQRRVVSLGQVEYTQRNFKTGEIDVLPARMYYDRDHPKVRWVELVGTPGRHVLDSGGEPEKVTKLPPLKNGMPRGPSPLTEPPVDDPPPRPV